MRTDHCPVCKQTGDAWIEISFGKKMKLPTRCDLRHCQIDNFLFVAGCNQIDYDQYYATVANDTYHKELAGGSARSPISRIQSDHLASALGGFFDVPRNVLDFGCGEASLLVELASNFPTSVFIGFEPGPAALIASRKAKMLELENLSIARRKESAQHRRYDLVIASCVIEHVIDFDILHLISDMLVEDGLLYVEVPNSLRYMDYERLEFLYYFDRLHVNHFTPQSLARLMGNYGFGYLQHFEYSFPYRDGHDYPGLGVLFRKGASSVNLNSKSILNVVNFYLNSEKSRAKNIAETLTMFEGVLVWGAGDNFYRSVGNDGPLSSLRQLVLLDSRSLEIVIGNTSYRTMIPQDGIRKHDWPVVITVSEGRKDISHQVADIDPGRRIFLI
jgi:2-polyprenyl-3-methyl-5-hydroxy-6-metoxy-1,4-benzoquinol methylase